MGGAVLMTTALDILRSGHLTRNEGLPTHTVRTTPDRARERSGFEPWPGTLCCVLWQDSHGASLHPRCINGYRRIYCWEIYLRWISIPRAGERRNLAL